MSNLVSLSASEKLTQTIKLVEANLKAAQEALSKTKQSITELQSLANTSTGIAKKELAKVIKHKQEHETELSTHLKEGKIYLEAKVGEQKQSLVQTEA